MYYYIHGYLSDPNSTKGLLLKEKLGVEPIKYRDCKPEDLIISECVGNILDEIKNDSNPVLFGSSLGGFLSVLTAIKNPKIKQLILMNPAIIHPSIDILRIKDMPQRILKEMYKPGLFNEKIDVDIFILVGTLDDVVPNEWVIEFAKAQEATVMFLKDDHSFANKLFELPNIFSNILNKKH